MEVLSVSLSRVELERSSSLGTVSDGFVQGLEDGQVGPESQRAALLLSRAVCLLFELGGPVEGTSSGGGGAGVVHVVHTVFTDQGEERLSGLLDSLVESLGRGVAVLSEDLVLGQEHSLDTTHEDTSLSVEVRVDFLFESGVVAVTGTDTDGHGDGLFLCLASDVLVDGDRGVDTSTLLEESSDGSS